MCRSALTALLLCILAHLSAQPVDLGISSLYEWPKETEACWSLSAGDLRIQLRTSANALNETLSLDQVSAIAVTLPWIRIGPLRPTGAMREASDPLGFSALSSVFRERTGLSVKGSLPSGEQGFLCMPIPDELGLFCVPLAAGGEEWGFFCSLPPRHGVSAEGFISLSQPAPSEQGDEWYHASPPFPGGAILDTACRFLLRSAGFSIAATAGASTGERVEPGMFAHLRLSAQGRGLDATLLIGGADAAYRTPEGEASADMIALSSCIEAAYAPCRARLGYSAEVRQPGFPPGSVLPTRETICASLTRGFPAGAGRETAVAVEARKIVSFDTGGRRSEAAGWCARIWTTTREWEGRAEAGYSDEEGWRCALSCQATAGAGLTLGTDAELGDCFSVGRTGSALVRIRLRGGARAVSVHAGIDACPLSEGVAGLAEHFVLRISWNQAARFGVGP